MAEPGSAQDESCRERCRVLRHAIRGRDDLKPAGWRCPRRVGRWTRVQDRRCVWGVGGLTHQAVTLSEYLDRRRVVGAVAEAFGLLPSCDGIVRARLRPRKNSGPHPGAGCPICDHCRPFRVAAVRSLSFPDIPVRAVRSVFLHIEFHGNGKAQRCTRYGIGRGRQRLGAPDKCEGLVIQHGIAGRSDETG